MTQRGPVESTTPTFQQFFASEHKRLLVVALALTPDREAARDAVQESLSRAFARWDDVWRMEQPSAWTRRVLINLLIDRHRRHERELVAVSRFGSRVDAFAPQPEVDEFLDIVRQLPERQRVAVVLHYLDDLSIEQVAAAMGVAAGTVKALLFKARQKLSADLAPKETAP